MAERECSTVEEWRVIAALPNYAVSSLGRVRRETPGHITYAGRILSTRTGTKYPRITFRAGSYLVHRLVADAFLAPPASPDMEINHKNGDQCDNRATNLEWVTAQENMLHAADNGLTAKGERNANAILTEDEVRAIWHECQDGRTRTAVAREHGVSLSTVSIIMCGKRWRHVTARLEVNDAR